MQNRSQWRVEPGSRHRILGPEDDPSSGNNLNGPSPIRVPEWISNPLGRYYLYFGHHHGQFIRMAYADHPEGPWKIHPGGTLHLKQAPQFYDHIASPDVIVDHERRQIRMYFHGCGGEIWWQESAVALSADGIHFVVLPGVTGPFYLRAFQWQNQWWALARNGNHGPILLEGKDGLGRFRWMREVLPRGRHVAVWVQGDVLWVFYSRVGDAPERILVSRVEMRGHPNEWLFPEGEEVLRPELPWEGSLFPCAASQLGSAIDVHQLRDPGILECEEGLYLYYSAAGESCLGVAKLQ